MTADDSGAVVALVVAAEVLSADEAAHCSVMSRTT
jgi:hypothetical protein